MKHQRERETAHHACVRLLKKGVECGNSKAPQPKEASAAKSPHQKHQVITPSEI